MRTILSTEIRVSRVALFAEMAWMVRRPELGLICRAAREHGRRITADLIKSVLPGLADTGAINIIAWCQMLELCDAGGGLTALGEDVAESDEAPVPEQGVYSLWLAQHPVIGSRVLSVERLASNKDQRFESIEPLVVEPDRGKVFRSVLDGMERFMVRDLPTNHGHPGAIAIDTRANCKLRWTLDFDHQRDQWQLDGIIEHHQDNGKYTMRPMHHEPESDGLDLWNLAENWATGPFASFGRWQASDRRLYVTFEGLNVGEIKTFRKTLSLSQVEIPGKGVYENVTLEDVPIAPASSQDAHRWAMARFDHHFSEKPGYRSRAEVREQFAQLTEDTPLEPFEPTLPSHKDLLAQVEKDLDRYWSLAAPVDLAPFPAAIDLGELRIGSPASTTTVEQPGVVRIPYQGGWTMRRLVELLLAGNVPLRVLLCDRYVSGEDNLVALKNLVGTLRSCAPSVEVHVWTMEDRANFNSIQKITGTVPLNYRDVFGWSQPHDRYLLVQLEDGQGFGWHMSNSPIHARGFKKGTGPDTPLRWKDLAAIQVNADQLEPRLGHWISGG